uniref:cGMP-dependent protein kinase n=1 Tax=Hanusia phi TaxID=3032 RepID=A0A7S0EQR9_9CRYP
MHRLQLEDRQTNHQSARPTHVQTDFVPSPSHRSAPRRLSADRGFQNTLKLQESDSPKGDNALKTENKRFWPQSIYTFDVTKFLRFLRKVKRRIEVDVDKTQLSVYDPETEVLKKRILIADIWGMTSGDKNSPNKLIIRLSNEHSDIECEFASTEQKMLFITLIRDLNLPTKRKSSDTKDTSSLGIWPDASTRQSFLNLGLLRKVDPQVIQQIESLLKPRVFAKGHTIARHGAACTHLYFIMSGSVSCYGPDGRRMADKGRGEFLGSAELMANAAARFQEMQGKVMLSTAFSSTVVCNSDCEAMELRLEALLPVLCSSDPLYENLYAIATARASVRGIKFSQVRDAGEDLEQEALTFDQLTQKQKMRLRAAGMTEEDVMENPELVLQILRTNEGLDTEALRTFQLFRMVDKPTLTRIANQLRPRRFNAGEYVLRAGDPGDSMFFINSGRVAAVVNGHELEPMRMGQFFGEIALVSHCAQYMGQSGFVIAKRTADVVCKESCDLLELHKDVVIAILDSAPKLKSTFFQALKEMAEKRLSRDEQSGDVRKSTRMVNYSFNTASTSCQSSPAQTPLSTAMFSPMGSRRVPPMSEAEGSPRTQAMFSPRAPDSPLSPTRSGDLRYAEYNSQRQAPPPINGAEGNLTLQKLPTQKQFTAVASSRAKIKNGVDPRKHWDTLQKLAKGSSGAVYLGQPKDKSSRERWPRVAIKKFAMNEETELEELENEIQIMSVSSHPNLVEYIDAYNWSGRLGGTKVWVVMEAMQYGAMNEILEKGWKSWYCGENKSAQHESLIAYMMRETFQGLAYLHSFSRIHRDIKSDNILVGAGGTVKIADFGFCVQLTKENQSRSSVLGTPYWMAPEVIREKPYTTKVDVWSTGVVLRECAQKNPPYFTETVFRAMYLISTKGIPGLDNPARWSKDLISFDKACLQVDAKHRMSSSEALDHP